MQVSRESGERVGETTESVSLTSGGGSPGRLVDRLPARLAPFVLAGSREGLADLPILLAKTVGSALEAASARGPLPVGRPGLVLAAAAEALGVARIPEEGVGSEAALCKVAGALIERGLDLSHPLAAAHLQPPPLAVAVAADALASASNASLDTYDSGPSAIAIERWLITALVELAGLGDGADGVLTPGGSMSNLLGLLLARDAAALRRGVDARRDGVRALPRPVVLCSELAHFSVQRACAALGLGEGAVRLVPSDAERRLDAGILAEMLRGLGPHDTPLAVVATAGTTDFGSIDPLDEIANLARTHGVWLHVDAAYGFGTLFSERLAGLVRGLEQADSITLDLHKLGWQPAAASVLLVARAEAFTSLEREVAYLNPSDDAEQGLDGLLGRSLQTTRRLDALKVAATFLAHGRRGLGEMVDVCHALAVHAERCILSEPALELVAPAVLTTVVFRFRPPGSASSVAREDAIQGMIRRELMERGVALIGRTSVRVAGGGDAARVCLKLTLLNPTAGTADIESLLDAVVRVGRAAEQHLEAGCA